MLDPLNEFNVAVISQVLTPRLIIYQYLCILFLFHIYFIYFHYFILFYFIVFFHLLIYIFLLINFLSDLFVHYNFLALYLLFYVIIYSTKKKKITNASNQNKVY